MSVLLIFFKKYFEMLNKNGEKNDFVWNKRKVSKKHYAKKM